MPESPKNSLWWHRAPMTAFVEVPLAGGQPYRSIEIQQLEHDNAIGLVMATHRPTGELDVSFTPELSLDETWFRNDPFLSHMTFGSIGPGQFKRRSYEVGPRHVDVDVEVTHVTGATIRVQMAHRFRRRSQPWFVPAVRQDEPATMRFMSADYIRLLPRWVQTLQVTVDGSELAPRPFLLPKAVAPFHLARFSGGVFGVGLNQAGVRPVAPDNDIGEQVTVSNGDHHFTATLHGLATGALAGRFTVNSKMGVVATGEWTTTSQSPTATIELSGLTQQWFPGWGHPSRLALYGLRRLRRRNESWHWALASNSSAETAGRWSITTTS